jgi:hypothetical protein
MARAAPTKIKEWRDCVERTRRAPIGHQLADLEVESIARGQQGVLVRIPDSEEEAEARWIGRRQIPDEVWDRLERGTKLLAEVPCGATSPDSFSVVGLLHLADDFFWTLARVHDGRDRQYFHVVVPGWDPYVYVPALIERVPEDLRPRLVPGYELETQANLLETEPKLLRFRALRHFEAAPARPRGVPLYRTMLDVLSVTEQAGEVHAEVDITGFEGEGPIRIPASSVPWYLRPRLRPGTLLFAKVNLGETDPGRLKFFDFELAPQPGQDDVTARLPLLPDP